MTGLFSRFVEKRLLHAFQTGHVLPWLYLTIVGVVFAFALIMRVVDGESFPTFGRALWWSVETVTTVGYGDVVPEQPYGKLVASVLMLLGFGFLSLVTGTVASALVTRYASQHADPELIDMMRRIEERLARLEERGQGGR